MPESNRERRAAEEARKTGGDLKAAKEAADKAKEDFLKRWLEAARKAFKDRRSDD